MLFLCEKMKKRNWPRSITAENQQCTASATAERSTNLENVTNDSRRLIEASQTNCNLEFGTKARSRTFVSGNNVNVTEGSKQNNHKHNSVLVDTWSHDKDIVAKYAEKRSNEITVTIPRSTRSRTEFECLATQAVKSQNNVDTSLSLYGVSHEISTVDGKSSHEDLVTACNNNSLQHKSTENTPRNRVLHSTVFAEASEKDRLSTRADRVEHCCLVTSKLQCKEKDKTLNSTESEGKEYHSCSLSKDELSNSVAGSRVSLNCSLSSVDLEQTQNLKKRSVSPHLQVFVEEKFPSAECVSVKTEKLSAKRITQGRSLTSLVHHCHKQCYAYQHDHQLNNCKSSGGSHIYCQSNVSQSLFNSNYRQPVILRNKNRQARDKLYHHSAVELHADQKTEHQRIVSSVGQNVLSRSKIQIPEENYASTEVGKHFRSVPVTADRKRLCKSLSNITADDLLSIPCNSIHDRDKKFNYSPKTPHSKFVTPKKSRISSLISSARNSLVEHSNAMPKHSKQSRDSKNMNIMNTNIASKGELGTVELNSEENERKNGKGKVRTQATSSGNQEVIDNKSTRKVPKLPKSLFPFMRKNGKRPNSSTSKVLPLKTQSSEREKSFKNVKCSEKEVDCCRIEVKSNFVDCEPASMNSKKSPTVMEALGFKKLKVPSKKEQRNVHDDYAARVAKVRTSNTDRKVIELSSASLPLSEEARKHEGKNNTGEMEVVAKLRKKSGSRRNGSRYSADLTSISDHVTVRPRRRPLSSAVPAVDSTWRYSKYFDSADDVNSVVNVQTEATDGLANNAKHKDTKLKQTTTQNTNPETNTSKNENASSFQNNNSSFNDQLLHVRDRTSLYLEENFHLTPRSNSTPDAQIAINRRKSGSDLNDPSPPCPLAQPIYSSSGVKPRLASSCNSVFEEKGSADKANSKVQWSSETKETDQTVTKPLNKTMNSTVVLRSKSLNRDKNTLAFSVSKTPFTDQGNFAQKPPHIVQRIQSLKDFPSFGRPSKPTTPKPKKLITSNSTSSLTKANLQLSSQNLTSKQQTSSRQNSNQDISLDTDAGEVRTRSSAKNIQIRRRLSLQACLLLASESLEQNSQFMKEFDEHKRHSIGVLDSEKIRTGLARWSTTASSGASGNSRRIRKKIRPHSDVQNLRWDAETIPEHHEVSSSAEAEEEIPTNNVASDASSNGLNADNNQARSSAVEHNPVPRLLHCDASELLQNGVLGSCFSEEDISTIREQEFTSNTRLPRSLSVIGGIDTLPESLLKFYPIKYHKDRIRLYPTPSGHVTYPFWSFAQVLYERSRGEGSTVSGLSNESGYGTMTRKNAAHLRPNDTDDEDVFTRGHSSRLSNGDFPNEDGLFVEALWDHVTMDDDELGFKVGNVIRVIDMSNADWWWGELESNEGWFPATFVRILVNQHREDSENNDVISPRNDDDTLSISSHEYSRVTDFGEDLCQCREKDSTSSVHCSQCGRPLEGVDPANRRATESANERPQIIVSPPIPSVKKSAVNRDHIRKNVINEIVNSEKVFAGHLKDVIEGYLTRSRQRIDWFTNEQIATLFGNIEEIYDFQKKFAAELEAAVNKNSIHETELGNIFLNHKYGFTIYSEYCNNHPQALALLSQLLMTKKYIHFFEACRLLQRMIDIPLDGFLLTPVQKICKYPLQLAELLKYTAPEHPDYKPVQAALEAMREVAKMINERKRKMENIKKISMWQSSIVNWQGEDVLVQSNELVHSGEAYALSQSKNKPKPRMVFLFDHQMIICKKDILRKDLLYYKSRINLDRCDIFPIEGYSPRSSMNLSGDWSSSGSGSTQCGWKMVDKASGDSSVMICKCEDDFDKWMRAFPQEREIALSHRDDDMKKELIQDLLKTSLTGPRKPKDSGSFRAPPSYRLRSKLAQESHSSTKYKVHSPLEKNNASFFSNVAGKLVPFRRATVRESNVVY